MTKASGLKRNCFASVFEKYFEFQEAGQEGQKRAVINYREDETMLAYFLFVVMFSGILKQKLIESLLSSVQFLRILTILSSEKFSFR